MPKLLKQPIPLTSPPHPYSPPPKRTRQAQGRILFDYHQLWDQSKTERLEGAQADDVFFDHEASEEVAKVDEVVDGMAIEGNKTMNIEKADGQHLPVTNESWDGGNTDSEGSIIVLYPKLPKGERKGRIIFEDDEEEAKIEIEGNIQQGAAVAKTTHVQKPTSSTHVVSQLTTKNITLIPFTSPVLIIIMLSIGYTLLLALSANAVFRSVAGNSAQVDADDSNLLSLDDKNKFEVVMLLGMTSWLGTLEWEVVLEMVGREGRVALGGSERALWYGLRLGKGLGFLEVEICVGSNEELGEAASRIMD